MSSDVSEYGYEILRSQVGSGLHGTAVEGQDDRDEMGVLLEPPEKVIGLDHFDQYIYRTQPEGVRSGPGDLDLCVYSARKYLRLALAGNPSILILLYAPEEHLVVNTPLGKELQTLAPLIASRKAGPRFLGYLTSQKERLLGLRGSGHGRRGGGKREELIEKYGFDTKFAMHMVRLGMQGVEYLSTGRITVPVPGEDGEYLRALRQGQHSLDSALTKAGTLEVEIKDLTENGPLPPSPDVKTINNWLEDAYRRAWGWYDS